MWFEVKERGWLLKLCKELQKEAETVFSGFQLTHKYSTIIDNNTRELIIVQTILKALGEFQCFRESRLMFSAHFIISKSQ